jgi:hypothetical protein
MKICRGTPQDLLWTADSHLQATSAQQRQTMFLACCHLRFSEFTLVAIGGCIDQRQ